MWLIQFRGCLGALSGVLLDPKPRAHSTYSKCSGNIKDRRAGQQVPLCSQGQERQA